MPAQKHRPQSKAPASPSSETSAKSNESESPEWNYSLSVGNAAALAMITGKVDAGEADAGSLLRGEMDAEEQVAEGGATEAGAEKNGEKDAARVPPKAVVVEEAPAAPPTTDPGGKLSQPFRNNKARVERAKVTLTRSQANDIKRFQDNWVKNKARYQNVSSKTGVPAELIAAIHYRESSMSFNKYLHQGDPLGKKAVRVPKNIPLFYDWDKAAVHALNMKKGIRDRLNMTADTTDETALTSYAEAYNGLGYSNKGLASPYAFAGTDQYTGGMYVADHKFSRTAKDGRLGVLALTRSIDEQGAADVHAGGAKDERTDAQVWEAVLSGHVLRKGTLGREVEELQKHLVSAGFETDVDGDFGGGTELVVKNFQTSRGLKADGVVGGDTAAALNGGMANEAPASGAAPAVEAPTVEAPTVEAPAVEAPTVTAPTAAAPAVQAPEVTAAPSEWAALVAGSKALRKRASGAVVRYLQEQLTKAGFSLDVDGKFGNDTRDAVRSFQKSKGLAVDGVVGKDTAGALS